MCVSPHRATTGGCRHDAVSWSGRHECVCLLCVFKPRIFKLNLSVHNMEGGGVCGWPLGRQPWMGEALGCRGPPFRHQVQHGQQEAAEGVCLIFGPLVLFYQHVKQPPWLQPGDVTQVA